MVHHPSIKCGAINLVCAWRSNLVQHDRNVYLPETKHHTGGVPQFSLTCAQFHDDVNVVLVFIGALEGHHIGMA